MRSVEADAAVDGTAQTGALLLPTLFHKGQTELRLFTTLATLGTPRDVTLQKLRVESFFPIDDETRGVFRQWARRSLKAL